MEASPSSPAMKEQSLDSKLPGSNVTGLTTILCVIKWLSGIRPPPIPLLGFTEGRAQLEAATCPCAVCVCVCVYVWILFFKILQEILRQALTVCTPKFPGTSVIQGLSPQDQLREDHWLVDTQTVSLLPASCLQRQKWFSRTVFVTVV